MSSCIIHQVFTGPGYAPGLGLSASDTKQGSALRKLTIQERRQTLNTAGEYFPHDC